MNWRQRLEKRHVITPRCTRQNTINTPPCSLTQNKTLYSVNQNKAKELSLSKITQPWSILVLRRRILVEKDLGFLSSSTITLTETEVRLFLLIFLFYIFPFLFLLLFFLGFIVKKGLLFFPFLFQFLLFFFSFSWGFVV